nr:cyclic AMP-dependent transcription factor ATF-5-like [Tanacetum cinerariifolium]
MGSRTRKLSVRDDDLPESSEEAKTTRQRLGLEPLGYAIQEQSVDTDQDSPRPTELALFKFLCVDEQQQQPQPPPVNNDQDQDEENLRETELTMYFLVQEPTKEKPDQEQPPRQQAVVNNQDLNGEKLPMYLYLQGQEPQQQQQPDNNPTVNIPQQPQQKAQAVTAPGACRIRKKPSNLPGHGKSATVEPPFLWATDRRAQVHSLKYLTDKGIKAITGDVECKRCQKVFQIEYNLEEKFSEIAEYVATNKFDMCDRAPKVWTNPVLPKCNFCHQENCVKPVINKKKSINWLFLLLGQMLGCCTLGQLKYFCKHTGNHRTGAKDRVLFLAYLGLCKQVNPDGPFDRE